MSSTERQQQDWKRAGYRVICSCQIHARRERTLWRRSLRAASQIRARGIALIIGVPLALGALQLPTEAMDVTMGAAGLIQSGAVMPAQGKNTFAIFTQRTGNPLLETSERTTVTLDCVKEQFFRINVPYGSIIYREAVRNRLAPELVAAVVESESDFRPRLVSNKNALGLMQIMPETGRLMGAEDLFNPTQNIAAGTKYLRYLLDRFPDQGLALAAYNAGEGNVERFGGVPPFEETQNYLRRVGARTVQYRQRIHGTYLASVRIQNSLVLR